jgi:hypothetical protein
MEQPENKFSHSISTASSLIHSTIHSTNQQVKNSKNQHHLISQPNQKSTQQNSHHGDIGHQVEIQGREEEQAIRGAPARATVPRKVGHHHSSRINFLLDIICGEWLSSQLICKWHIDFITEHINWGQVVSILIPKISSLRLLHPRQPSKFLDQLEATKKIGVAKHCQGQQYSHHTIGNKLNKSKPE